jgi:SH3 domain protein
VVRSAALPGSALAIVLAIVLAIGGPWPASGEWIGDRVRVELRTGPGQRHRSLRTLESGERVEKLANEGGWTQVRASDGAQGWVPESYVSSSEPASERLKGAAWELDAARHRVAELQRQLAGQTDPDSEMARLRARIEELESQLASQPEVSPSGLPPLGTSPRWQTLGMGALILLLGMGIGLVLPRSGARARKIKF